MTREEALEVLLAEIVIQPDWPLDKARLLITRACDRVNTAYPFFDKEERKRAGRWREKIKDFDYLWD